MLIMVGSGGRASPIASGLGWFVRYKIGWWVDCACVVYICRWFKDLKSEGNEVCMDKKIICWQQWEYVTSRVVKVK